MPNNPPAFPNNGAYGHTGDYLPEGGMTLRDWFAGQVMAGLLASSNATAETWEEYATDAYEMANAMLAERERVA